MRKGYMGHLTRIANTVVQNAEREQEQTQIAQLIKGSWLAHWECFWEDLHVIYIFNSLFEYFGMFVYDRATRGL